MADQEPIQSFNEFRNSLYSASYDNFHLQPNAKIESKEAFDEMRNHLLALYEGVEVPHSFLESGGHIVDCLPAEQQPSLRKSGLKMLSPPPAPLLPNSTYSAHPDFVTKNIEPPLPQLRPDYRDRFGNQMWCPAGTIPMLRTTLPQLSKCETLRAFFHGARKLDDREASNIPPQSVASVNDKRYARAMQQIDNLGGFSNINIWKPQVLGTQAIMSQQWYETPPLPFSTFQSVECGYQIGGGSPFDAHPRLFVYYTKRDYRADSGGYNLYSPGFEYSVGATHVLGGALTPSQSGGSQFDYQMGFSLTGGAWWFWFNGEWIGYYRTSLFDGGRLASSAGVAAFGGESTWFGTFPPIGSGAFPTAGFGKAAYQRNVAVTPLGGSTQVANLVLAPQFPSCFNTVIANNSPSTWATYFLFGGPGGIQC
jgi:Neprosin